MTDSVSVIIPNFNYGRFLSQTINSVLNQSHADIEVIVIDNGSTDNSREVLESFEQKIKVIYQGNRGQAEARNTGIALATGNLIALLDADDYWEPTKLENQIGMITNEYQFVYTGFRQFDSNTGITVKEVSPFFEGDCRLHFLEYPSRAIVPGGESSALLTRRLAEEVGIFTPGLNSASGRDFFRRCSIKTKFAFVNEFLMNYRLHSSNLSRNSQAMMADTAEAYRFLFADPDWQFARKYRHKCLSRLHWSFAKTLLKEGRFVSALPDLMQVVIN